MSNETLPRLASWLRQLALGIKIGSWKDLVANLKRREEVLSRYPLIVRVNTTELYGPGFDTLERIWFLHFRKCGHLFFARTVKKNKSLAAFKEWIRFFGGNWVIFTDRVDLDLPHVCFEEYSNPYGVWINDAPDNPIRELALELKDDFF